MRKKLISLALVVTLSLTTLSLAGCSSSNKEYPVTVGSITVKECPENIVVLDRNVADIISCIGYEVKMVGRSEDVNQASLNVAPVMGTEEKPDIDAIVDAKTEIVFGGNNLSAESVSQLEEKNITVVKINQGTSSEEILTSYMTIGAFLGGSITGRDKASTAYGDLFSGTLTNIQSLAENTTSAMTIAYLYLDDSGKLTSYTKGSYGAKILGYTGAINIAENLDNSTIDSDTLSVANPDVIIYDNADVMNYINTDDTLKKLTAVKNNKCIEIDRDTLALQGTTAMSTVCSILLVLNPDLKKQIGNKSLENATNAVTEATVATTQPTAVASTAATEATTEAIKDYALAKNYDIKLTDAAVKKNIKNGENNKYITAMQNRLIDLGYLGKDLNTGYYGDKSADAVKTFQKNNKLKATGDATVETIKLMFSSKAKKK